VLHLQNFSLRPIDSMVHGNRVLTESRFFGRWYFIALFCSANLDFRYLFVCPM